MIADLKPYPAMKDSGVEWLGEVPEHWGQVPGSSCFSEKQVSNAGMVEKTVLSLSYGRIVVKPEEKLRGLFSSTIDGKAVVVEYEPDTDLRDTEQIPLLEEGDLSAPVCRKGRSEGQAGIEAFIQREVLPCAPDVWYVADSVKTSYEISFTRYFYKPQPMRSLEEIRADILAVEKKTEGLLGEILGGMQG